MADNTIGWGQGSVNNTNDWGKGKANSTNDWGSIYANSPSGDTNIEGGSAVTGLLADYPNAAGAYSLRNLISTTTNVVRVRRSSDNAEQDFSATEITDGTLTTFTGANDGFVTTWYDQSGNSNNASQSTAASQPKIVNSGTVISENSKSAIEMDGVNDFLTVPYSSELNVQIASSTVVAVYRKSAGFRVMQTNLNGTGVGSNYWFLDGSSILSVAGAYTTSYPYNQDVQKLELATWDGNLIFNYRNGVKMIPNSVSNGTIVNGGINPLYSPTSNTAGFLIGKRDFSSTGIMTGKFQEIIIYDSDQTLNKSGIETNINNHYSIY